MNLAGQTNGNQVTFSTNVPGGLTANTIYYVVNATGSTFQVASTPGGPPLTFTNSGSTAVVNESGAITALAPSSYTADAWGTGDNTTVMTSSSPASGSTTSTLRFNSSGASDVITLGSGTSSITTGGILDTANVVNPMTIVGGTLTTGTSELIINQWSSAPLTISSLITGSAR